MKCEPLIINGARYYSILHISNLKFDCGYTWDRIAKAYDVSKTAIIKWFYKYQNLSEEFLDKDGDYKSLVKGGKPRRIVDSRLKSLPPKEMVENSWYELRNFLNLSTSYMPIPIPKKDLEVLRSTLAKIYNMELTKL